MKIIGRLETFIKMCENDFEEDEHVINNPLTYDEFEEVQQLVIKLRNCVDYVDGSIFK